MCRLAYIGRHTQEQHKNLKLYSALRHTLEIFMTLDVLSSTMAGVQHRCLFISELNFAAATVAS